MGRTLLVCLLVQLAFALAALVCLFALDGRFAGTLVALSFLAFGVRLGYGKAGKGGDGE